MENEKNYKFAVHSAHFLHPLVIKKKVRGNQKLIAILEDISREATAKWLKEHPDFFDNITAPEFYDSISITVLKEEPNV